MTQIVREFERTAQDSVLNKTKSQVKNELERYRQQYRQVYQLRLDLRRQEYHGREMKLFLDFSEIFPYLYPDPSDPDSRLIWTVIRLSKSKFGMAYGTVYELLEHVRALTNDHRRLSRDVRASLRDYYGTGQVSEFVNLMRQQVSPEIIKERIDTWWGPNSPLGILLDKRPLHLSKLRALVNLDDFLSNHVDPLSELRNFESVDMDDFTFRRVIQGLSTRRPNLSKSNRLDAINYAYLMKLNTELGGATKKYYALLSRGIPFQVLNGIYWEQDEIKQEGSGLPPSIARELPYVLFSILVERLYEPLDSRVRFVRTMREELLGLIGYLEGVLEEVRDQRLDYVIQDVKSVSVLVPQTVDYLENADPDIAGQLMEFLGLVEGVEGTHPSESDGSIVQELSDSWDKWLSDPRAARTTVIPNFADSAKKLRGLERRLEDHVAAAEELVSSRVRNWIVSPSIDNFVEVSTKDANESEIWDGAKTLRLCSLSFSPDYFIIKCNPRGGQFHRFCELIGFLFSQTSELDATEQNLNSLPKAFPDSLAIFDKEGKGLAIGMDALQFPIDANALWRTALQELDGVPTYLRFNNKYFDCWYYNVPRELGTAVDAGFASHLPIGAVCATFIATMTERLMAVESLGNMLDQILIPRYVLSTEGVTATELEN